MSKEIDPAIAAFGLTGGMGAGKSTVSRLLSGLGAEIFDADATAKELQEPGQPGLSAMIEVLGGEILDENGRLDRKKAADIMFADPKLLKKINEVIHPMVWETMINGANELSPDKIAVFDVPILDPVQTKDMVGVIVVNTSVEIAIERLKSRGYSPEEAEKRIRRQITNEERVAMADFVIVNDGTQLELETEVSRVWAWMRTEISKR